MRSLALKKALHVRPPRYVIRAGEQEFPFLRNVEKAEATAALADYVDEARKGPVVVTVRGRPVAVLARVKGIDLEDLSMSTDPDFFEMLRRSRRGKGIPIEQVRRELGLDPPHAARPRRRSR